MPVKKSAIKALRQDKKKADRNKKIKSDIIALVRKVRLAVSKKDQPKAVDLLKQAIKKIDKAAQKGILKKNTAARKKSRLHAAIKKLGKNQ